MNDFSNFLGLAKKYGEKFLRKTYLLAPVTMLRAVKVLEFDYGHFKSTALGESVDRQGNPVPWFCYPAIDYLMRLNLSGKKVFEYGSGSSTLFWDKNADLVLSVEHDRGWFETVNKNLVGESKVYLEEDLNRYPKYISKLDSPDIIVIDGKVRDECAKEAIKHIKEDGLIILDNPNQASTNKAAANILRRLNFIEVTFTGFLPMGPHPTETSFFFGRDFESKKK